MEYSKEVLDEALLLAQSSQIAERKLGEKVLRQATCLELGTKNTIPVRDWFTSNTEKIMQTIKREKDSRLLWGYIYMLHSFCGRYIQEYYLVRNSEDFIKDKKTIRFREQAIALVKSMTEISDLKVLQAVGSFFWLYGDSQAWDVFLKVLSHKRDSLTISHIAVAVSQCYHVVVNRREKCDYNGDLITDCKSLITKEQVIGLINRFSEIEKKTSTKKLTCGQAIENLKEILKKFS